MRSGAIEAGGTKFVCGRERMSGGRSKSASCFRFPTELPEPTLERDMAYFTDKNAEVFGLGSFGPLGLDPDCARYGHVTTTPKPGKLKSHFNVPYGWVRM